MFKFFKIRVRQKHTINLIAEFDTSSESLFEISSLTEYLSEIGSDVKVTTNMQRHPAGYRITSYLEFYTRSRKKINKYARYVANMDYWLVDVSVKSGILRYCYIVE